MLKGASEKSYSHKFKIILFFSNNTSRQRFCIKILAPSLDTLDWMDYTFEQELQDHMGRIAKKIVHTDMTCVQPNIFIFSVLANNYSKTVAEWLCNNKNLNFAKTKKNSTHFSVGHHFLSTVVPYLIILNYIHIYSFTLK